jgi:hypothetical protein
LAKVGAGLAIMQKRPNMSLNEEAEFATEFHGKFIARRYLPLSLFVATANILQKKI